MDQTKAEEIALALEDGIVAGTIEPGTVLRQDELCLQFGVSRTPVREALSRLAALRLVSFQPNRGASVRPMSESELQQAFLLRSQLEGLVAEVATPLMTSDDFEELGEVQRRFEEVVAELIDPTGTENDDRSLAIRWVRADYAFHDVIYRAANLPYIARIAKRTRWTVIHPLACTSRSHLSQLYERNARQHVALIDAMEVGSARTARVMAEEHVLDSLRLVQGILEMVDPTADGGRRRAR